MRTRTFVISTATVVLSFTSLLAWTDDLWIVEPGNVEVRGKIVTSHGRPTELQPPQYVRGSFRLRKSIAGAPLQKGGACMIYLPKNPTDCTSTNAICAASGGYCAAIRNETTPSGELVGAGRQRACWHKPNPESCIRSGYNDLGGTQRRELPWVSAYPPDAEIPVPWRVVSCQS